MNNLGTILPTSASLAATDKWYSSQVEKRKAIERKTFPDITPVYEQMESRFYTSANRYGVVSTQDLKTRFFIRKTDGHWYAEK